jgi:CheY-like chemotaxis protein
MTPYHGNPAPGPSDSLPANRPAPDGRLLRVLVVEDNPDSAESTALILRLYGHDVRTAGDGSTALSLAAAAPPDVVLLDIGLPGMDGCEVARRLRAAPPGGKRPLLVAISGYGQPDDRGRAEAAGVHLYFLKPLDMEQLQKLLEGYREHGPGP